MIVYRLENQKGEGIYAIGVIGFEANRVALIDNGVIDGVKSSDEYDRLHPGPADDKGLAKWWDGPSRHSMKKRIDWHVKGRRAYSCGFISEEQMLTWFPPEGFDLMLEFNERTGVRMPEWMLQVSLYKIHANKVRKGEFQAMFRKSDAELIETRSIERYSARAARGISSSPICD